MTIINPVPFILYCGISDILDRFIARISKNETKFGERLDSVAAVAETRYEHN